MRQKQRAAASLPLAEYLSYIRRGEIPPAPPACASPLGMNEHMNYRGWQMEAIVKDVMQQGEARDECARQGAWLVIDQVWARALALHLQGRRVLEIMAGGGWLAKALAEAGASVIATDDYSWTKRQHKGLKPVYPVERLGALAAVARYEKEADVLLCSWPPYGSETFTRACELWGSAREIVYIGEGPGGCNAPESFFRGFRELEPAPLIPLLAWPGLHDRVYAGHYRPLTSKRGRAA